MTCLQSTVEDGKQLGKSWNNSGHHRWTIAVIIWPTEKFQDKPLVRRGRVRRSHRWANGAFFVFKSSCGRYNMSWTLDNKRYLMKIPRARSDDERTRGFWKTDCQQSRFSNIISHLSIEIYERDVDNDYFKFSMMASGTALWTQVACCRLAKSRALLLLYTI